MANNSNIYPLTIIRDRYCGSYSGGTYVAFNLESPEYRKKFSVMIALQCVFGNILKEWSVLEEVLKVR